MKIISKLTLVIFLSLLMVTICPFLIYGQTQPVANISLSKTASDTSVWPGTTVSYLFNATNTGDTALTGAIYDDVIGDIGNFVDLSPGGWVAFNVSQVLNQSTLNNATVYGVDSYSANVTDTASAYIEVTQPMANISLSKTASDTSVLPGTIVSYLFNATNTGDTELTGAIYDDVIGPVGNFVGLVPGGWVGFNISRVLNQSTLNNATAYGVDIYGANVTSTASAYVEVIQPLKVCKTGTPKTQPAPGTITWNVTVTNIGEVPLTGVNVTDSQHGYLGSAPTLNPGQTVFFTIVEAGLPPGTYVNNATAYAYYEPTDSVISDSDTAVSYIKRGFVVPEVPFGTLMISASMFIGLAFYFAIPKIRKK